MTASSSRTAGIIDLVSIGVVDEYGREFYAVSTEFDDRAAVPWVRRNVLDKLPSPGRPGVAIARRGSATSCYEFLVEPMRDRPDEQMELWAWYAAYDHVVLAQLWGAMPALPREIPRFTKDLRQLWDDRGRPPLPDAAERGTTRWSTPGTTWPAGRSCRARRPTAEPGRLAAGRTLDASPAWPTAASRPDAPAQSECAWRRSPGARTGQRASAVLPRAGNVAEVSRLVRRSRCGIADHGGRAHMRIGVLTGGGDCPGLNAVIRAVVRKGVGDLRARVRRASGTAGGARSRA